MSKLTGNTRFRTTWRGKMVLQVQFFYLIRMYGEIHSVVGWRDAQPSDINAATQSVEVHKYV